MKREWGIWLRRGTGALATVLFSTALLVPSLRADDSGQAAARAVRLSSVDGDVQLQQGNQMLADHAVANTPLFEGTQVTTGTDGRAEIQFEDGSVARLSPEGSFTLKRLRGKGADSDTELVLNSGLGYFEMQGDNDGGGLRVRFGYTVVTASGFTVLRVNLDKMPGEVAVFSGNAHLEGAGNLQLDVHGGESVALNGTDPSQYNLSESIEPDSWDTWNADRDQALTTAAASRTDATKGFADSNNPAWSDLDANGSWYDVPNQGRVWSPYEASNPGFDPYGSGYWMYTPRFGYMWVSGYSWGYMPFQCGAWNYFNSFGWGWAPGACSPWWGGVGYGFGGFGGGGWIANIGNAPPRYRLPDRPRPRNPRPMGGMRSVASLPVVAVNRKVEGGSTMLPVRDKTHSVMIGGTVAEPLRPVANRPHYDHGQVFSGNRPITSAPAAGFNGRSGNDRPIDRPGADRPGYIRTPNPNPGGVNTRPGGWPATGDNNNRQNGTPAPRQVGPPPSQNPPAGSYSRPSAPSRGTSAPSAPPPSRPSGGGGAPMGGGGSRPSAGGGAPAGGGSHPSGGPHR